MRTKYKPWALPYLTEHKEVQIKKDNISSLFDVYLEIGSGKGGFLVKKSINNPDKYYVGIEKNVSCAGIACKALVENSITNGKIIYADAEEILLLLKDKSINDIFLNFSDPWPKKRHHKRRLTTNKFLDEYFRILKDDGEIIFKTDNKELFEFSLETLTNHKFQITYISFDYKELELGDEETEYEQSFRLEGLPIYRFKARKKVYIC